MYRTQLPQHSIYNSRDKNLEQYHKDELQPTETFNRQWNLAIDALASFLKQNSGFSVAETVKENERGRPKIPKSYALELITIHVWESIGSPQRFELDRMLKLVLKHLVNSSYTNATWYDYYSVADANKYSRDTQVHRKPFILDPADPFHNVGADFDWTEISQMAEATFNSPRLRGVTEGV